MAQYGLKVRLRQLGYYPSDENEEIPDLPSECVSLVGTLVDDLAHSQDRLVRVQAQIERVNEQVRELGIQVVDCIPLLKVVGESSVSGD
jgi:hypothetical protein